MSHSTLTQKGQATIPADVRKKLGLQPGDKVGFKIEKDNVIVVKITPFDSEYHIALAGSLSEWNTPEDDEAYEDL